jgi:hypothetical protein
MSLIVTTLFQRDEYNKKTPQATQNVLQFLIALKQPLKIIQGYLDKHPTDINGRNNLCGHLSPLAVSALTGRHDVAEFLLSQKADPTLSDTQDFTPLHHAALRGDERMIDLLLRTNRVAQEALRNCLGQTAQDLTRAIAPHPFPRDDEVVFQFQNPEGKIVPGTAAQFRQLTGKQYVRSLIWTRKSMEFNWVEGFDLPNTNSRLNAVLQKKYKAYLRSGTPRTYVVRKKTIGCSVRVAQPIRALGIVCIYKGKMIDEASASDEHLYNGVDGSQFCNEGPLIADSFPNSALCPISFEGKSVNCVYALRNLKSHEDVCIDYGISHPLKLGRHIELNRQELEQYFQKNSLQTLLKYFLEKRLFFTTGNEREEFGFLNTTLYLGYLLETPASLFDLILKEIVRLDALKFLLENEGFDDLFADFDQVELIASAFLQFFELLNKQPQDQDGIKAFFSKQNRTLTARTFVLLLYWVIIEESIVLSDLPPIIAVLQDLEIFTQTENDEAVKEKTLTMLRSLPSLQFIKLRIFVKETSLFSPLQKVKILLLLDELKTPN